MWWTVLLDVLAHLGAATTDPVWAPILAWTVLALPLWALLKQTDRLHPLAEYRLSQVLLAALPIGIGAVSIAEMLPEAARSSMLPAQSVVVLPAIEPRPVSASVASWSWMHTVGLLTIGTLGAGLYQLGRLTLEILAVRRVRRRLRTNTNLPLRAEVDRLRERLNVGRRVALCRSSDVDVPMTLGGLRPAILVPERLTETAEALRMTLRHELVHVRRWDDLAQLLERAIAAVFIIHPLVGRLRRQVDEARERACDAAVLHNGETPASDYARLLTAFAEGASPHRLGALSLSESPSSLKRRLSAMRSSMSSLLSSRLTLGTALIGIGLALTFGMVACSDSVGPSFSSDAEKSDTAPQPQSATTEDSSAYRTVEDPPRLKGGIKALQESVTYPEMAKDDGIEGRVIVQFVVDKEGHVTNPRVARGAHKLLNEAVLKAVREQTFEPGRKEGEPVRVRMSLPVTFRLPDGSPEGEMTSSQVKQKTGREKITLELRSTGKIYLNGEITSLDHLREQILQEIPDPKNSILSIKVRSGAPQQLKNEVLRELRKIEMAKRSPRNQDIQG